MLAACTAHTHTQRICVLYIRTTAGTAKETKAKMKLKKEGAIDCLCIQIH